MWAETGLDTDAIDVEMIVEWFDKRRGIKESESLMSVDINREKITQFENGRAMVEYRCYACGELVNSDDTVWINPQNGIATMLDGGEPFHVSCAPASKD
jgi:hypothetical protein